MSGESDQDGFDLESLGEDEFFKELDSLIGNLDEAPTKPDPATGQEPTAEAPELGFDADLGEETGEDLGGDPDDLGDLDAMVADLEAVAPPEPPQGGLFETPAPEPTEGATDRKPSAKEIPILKEVVFKGSGIPGEAVSMLSALKTVKNTDNPVTAADIERIVEESIERHLEPLREELREIIERHIETVREDLKETLLTQINNRVLRTLPKAPVDEES